MGASVQPNHKKYSRCAPAILMQGILQPGVKKLSFLGEWISQDPLENYFGKQLARGGCCDNPTLKESLHNVVAICAQQSLELDRMKGIAGERDVSLMTALLIMTALHFLSAKDNNLDISLNIQCNNYMQLSRVISNN